MKRLLFCISIAILFTYQLSCQIDLSIFENLVGNQWIGHYQNSEDSLLTHFIEWKYDLAKHIVLQEKKVPEVNFLSKLVYYRDYDTNTLNYLALMNKKMISRGSLTYEDNLIVLEGYSYFPQGFQENRQTLQLTESGEIHDRFYRKKNDLWLLGHHIIYKKMEKK